MRPLAIASLTVCLWPALAAGGGAAPDPRATLQGTWIFTALTVDGQDTPPAALAGARLIITDDEFIMSHSSAVHQGTFAVAAAREPWTIDLTFTEGPHAGEQALGLWRQDGGDLVICLGLVGEPRPDAFAAPAGSGRALEVLTQDARAAAAPDVARVAPLPATPVLPGSDLAKLQGEWSLLSGARDGQPLPPPFVAAARRRARGDEVSVTFGGQLFMRARVALDEAAEPRTIDYDLTGGPVTGQRQLGIYAWEGDRVRFCFGRPGDPRPDDFAAPAGSGRTLTVWERRD